MISQLIRISKSNVLPAIVIVVALSTVTMGSVLMFNSHLSPYLLPPGSYLSLLGIAMLAVMMAIYASMTSFLQVVTKSSILRVRFRFGVFVFAILFTVGAWVFNIGNTFTPLGMVCWFGSILTWSACLHAAQTPTPIFLNNEMKGKDFFYNHIFITFLLITILCIGAMLRFSSLEAYPPDMSSDHVEKILDSYEIYSGSRPIFLSNNGGREVFYFYFLALLKSITHLPINFNLLKIAAGFWGMIGIIAAWWMGRSIYGANTKFGNLVGILVAAMIAISYWALMLSRLGLRIVLTPLVTTLLLIFLIRCLRYNRRLDYILSGLILGWGLYCYQACRILPVLVAASSILYILLRVRSWKTLRQFIVNVVAQIIIFLAVALPLIHYSIQYPADFWSRTVGRLIGYDYYDMNLAKPSDFIFQLKKYYLNHDAHVTVKSNLFEGVRRSLFMFNYQGDSSWFSGSGLESLPELDLFTGTFLLIGFGVLIARIIRCRDPADWLLILAFFILLLPSGLAVSRLVEVPSATRASGVLPVVYLIAALGLATLIRECESRIPVQLFRYMIYLIVSCFFVFAYKENTHAYFDSAMKVYRQSSLPHHQVGEILRKFSQQSGSPGNAFIISYPYWLDHRAVAIEAGDRKWQNSVVDHMKSSQPLLDMIRQNMMTEYRFKPDHSVLIFTHQADQPTRNRLTRLFPQGKEVRIHAFASSQDFILFIAPPVGCDWMFKYIGTGGPLCGNGVRPDPI